MKTTTVQLLPTTTYGTPSGNYDGSSEDWAGVEQKAANYYGGYGQLQTVAFFLLNFQGLIRIQATLDSVPESDNQWFEINVFDSLTSATTQNFSANLSGNYTWIRAKVEGFSAGTISKVTLSY